MWCLLSVVVKSIRSALLSVALRICLGRSSFFNISAAVDESLFQQPVVPLRSQPVFLLSPLTLCHAGLLGKV